MRHADISYNDIIYLCDSAKSNDLTTAIYNNDNDNSTINEKNDEK